MLRGPQTLTHQATLPLPTLICPKHVLTSQATSNIRWALESWFTIPGRYLSGTLVPRARHHQGAPHTCNPDNEHASNVPTLGNRARPGINAPPCRPALTHSQTFSLHMSPTATTLVQPASVLAHCPPHPAAIYPLVSTVGLGPNKGSGDAPQMQPPERKYGNMPGAQQGFPENSKAHPALLPTRPRTPSLRTWLGVPGSGQRHQDHSQAGHSRSPREGDTDPWAPPQKP